MAKLCCEISDSVRKYNCGSDNSKDNTGNDDALPTAYDQA